MDAMPPEKPPLIAQLDPSVKHDLEQWRKNKLKHPDKPKPLTVENYGPIKSMTLASDWKDLGIWPRSKNPLDKSHGGNRYKHHDYRLKGSDCTLWIPYDPYPDSHVAKAKAIIDTTTEPVSKEKWSELTGIFGSLPTPHFFTIHSVRISNLAGKRIVELEGIFKKDNHWEKTIYVSLSGDWNQHYEFGIGGSSDRATFDKEVAKFDKALKTVVWKSE